MENTDVRTPRRRRAAVAGLVLGLTAVVAACGGGGGGDGADRTTTVVTTDGGSGGATSTTLPRPPATDPEVVEGAKVRIVNLFVPAEGEPGPVDVVPGYRAAEDAEAVASIPFGEAGEYFAPPASNGRAVFSLYPQGSTDDADRLMQVDQSFVAGDQVTILLTTSENLDGKRTGATQVLYEEAGKGSTAGSGALEAAPSGKALVLGNASAIQGIGGDDDGFTYGVVGSGCLEDEDPTGTLVGGTSTLRYPVAPGSTELAAYPFDDNACSGDPAMGPATVDLAAGERAYVLVYGSGPTDRQLLVVPIP